MVSASGVIQRIVTMTRYLRSCGPAQYTLRVLRGAGVARVAWPRASDVVLTVTQAWPSQCCSLSRQPTVPLWNAPVENQ